MKIAIYGKKYSREYNDSVGALFRMLENMSFEVHVYEKYHDFLSEEGVISSNYPCFTRQDVNISQYVCLISIGGDGTLLDTATIIKDSKVPVLGINIGRLGFIPSISFEEVEPMLRSIATGTYETEERSLLMTETKRQLMGAENFALNEFTILKKDNASMIVVTCYINGEFLNTYWADGLIISTPTGSTAYSLSCGGPIITPGSDNFVITPVAPHNLNIRPIVIGQDATLKLTVEGRSREYLFLLDSRSETIYPGEEITITRAPFTFRLIKAPGHSFITALRNKLGWGMDRRN